MKRNITKLPRSCLHVVQIFHVPARTSQKNTTTSPSDSCTGTNDEGETRKER